MSVVFKVVYFVNLESDRVAHLAPGLFLIPICQPMVFSGNRFLFQERRGQETVNLVKVIPSEAIVKYAFDVRHIKILPKTDRGSLLGQMVRGIIWVRLFLPWCLVPMFFQVSNLRGKGLRRCLGVG